MFIALASTKILFLLLLLIYFGCYGNLEFPLTYNGKNEIGFNCCLIAGILTEPFQNCLLTSPPPSINIMQITHFDL